MRWKESYLKNHIGNHGTQKPGCFREGEIVLLATDEKRVYWPLAKILKLYEGRDGKFRSVTILCRGKSLKRSIQKICKLEIP